MKPGTLVALASAAAVSGAWFHVTASVRKSRELAELRAHVRSEVAASTGPGPDLETLAARLDEARAGLVLPSQAGAMLERTLDAARDLGASRLVWNILEQRPAHGHTELPVEVAFTGGWAAVLGLCDLLATGAEAARIDTLELRRENDGDSTIRARVRFTLFAPRGESP